MKRLVVILALVLGTLVSCTSTRGIKKVVEPPASLDVLADANLSEDEIWDKMKQHHIDYETFSAKIKLDVLTKDGKQPELTALVRIVKDSAIWVSLHATFLNIEVYRLLIKPNDVILLNKQDKEVQYRTMEYLQEVTHLPLDFYSIQDLLVGNPIFFEPPIANIKTNKQQYVLTTTNNVFKHMLMIDQHQFVPVFTKLDDVQVSRSRTATLTYEDYKKTSERLFAFYRHLHISEASTIDIKMRFKQVEFNKQLSVAFPVPSSYEVK